jgi:hypothetical protein
MDQAQRPKCGTCRFFVVRNPDEAMLAQIARPESECAPGEHTFQGQRIQGCVGGGVRGVCLKWQERGAPNQMVDSTFLCKLYQPGGPTLKGMEAQALSPSGSAARIGEAVTVEVKRPGPFSELLAAAAIGFGVVGGSILAKRWLGKD